MTTFDTFDIVFPELVPLTIACIGGIFVRVMLAHAPLPPPLPPPQQRPVQPFEWPELNLGPALKRFTAREVMTYSRSDQLKCSELYSRNELGRFPEGGLPEFEAALTKAPENFITLRVNNEIVGVGGISIRSEKGHVWLCYGLIHSQHHGRSLSSTLLTARLASLPSESLPIRVVLIAVPTSRGYYERFGFTYFGDQTIPGVSMSILGVLITKANSTACRLAMAGCPRSE